MAGDEWGDTTEQADFSLDGEGFSRDDLGPGGETIDKEGWYHLEVTDVKPDLEVVNNKGGDKSPSICFHLLALQTVQGQSPAGSRHYHRIYVGAKGGAPPSDGAVKSALRFGLGLGLIAEIEKDGRPVMVDKSTGLTKMPVSMWLRAKGMQFVAKVGFKPAEGKFPAGYEIPFGRCYQVDDPQVADTPKNKEALVMLTKGGSIAAVGKQSTTQGATQQKQETQEQTVPPDDDLSDL